MNPATKLQTPRAAMSVKEFIKHHFRHFNAAVVVDAAEAYRTHLAQGGKMFLAMAGAMSTAELGISLAEMIRQDKVHAHLHHGRESRRRYFQSGRAQPLPARAQLSQSERRRRSWRCANSGMNRVTDTCIPEEEAMRRIERQVLKFWQKADQEGSATSPTNTCTS